MFSIRKMRESLAQGKTALGFRFAVEGSTGLDPDPTTRYLKYTATKCAMHFGGFDKSTKPQWVDTSRATGAKSAFITLVFDDTQGVT